MRRLDSSVGADRKAARFHRTHGHGRAFVRLPTTDLPQRYLQPGDLLICREPCVVTTVLGSCIAVTFFSARLKLAAICHAMLPFPLPGHSESSIPRQLPWKYVSGALPELMRCFLPSGPRSDVEVKIIGGARVLQTTAAASARESVGSANIACARRLLSEAGFAICARDVGGTMGRKVVFDTRSGDVHVKCLRQTQTAA